jgi:hypothetical protein
LDPLEEKQANANDYTGNVGDEDKNCVGGEQLENKWKIEAKNVRHAFPYHPRVGHLFILVIDQVCQELHVDHVLSGMLVDLLQQLLELKSGPVGLRIRLPLFNIVFALSHAMLDVLDLVLQEAHPEIDEHVLDIVLAFEVFSLLAVSHIVEIELILLLLLVLQADVFFQILLGDFGY